MDATKKMETLMDNLPPELWAGGAYDFSTLSIFLKEPASPEQLLEEQENAACFVALVHEYIHFIQTFITTFGFTNFITYTDLFANFFIQNMGLPNNPSTPTKGGVVDQSFGVRTYQNYTRSLSIGMTRSHFDGKLLFNSTREEDFLLIGSNAADLYQQKECFICYISYKRELIALNPLVLRETMAIVASYLASGIPLAEAKKTITTIWGPQYHIIYSFLDHFFPDKNCFTLAYFVAEISLLIAPYNETIFEILNYVRNNATNFSQLTENEIIKSIKGQIDFENRFRSNLQAAQAMLEKRIETYSRHEGSNPFYTHIKSILSLFTAGFAERSKNPFTYRDVFDRHFLHYFAGIIKSPILIFPDGNKSMLGQPDPEYINTISTFSGILTVFVKTYFGTITKCPFATDHSLCSAEKGRECYEDPFAVFGQSQYEGCLLDNALRITGLRKVGRT